MRDCFDQAYLYRGKPVYPCKRPALPGRRLCHHHAGQTSRRRRRRARNKVARATRQRARAAS